MSIPFFRLLSMMIVRPKLKIDVLKMEQVSFIGYCEGETTLYFSSTNLKGEEELVSKYIPSWSFLWTHKNAKFEKFLLEYLDCYQLCGKMFHIQDGNHYLRAWWPYIDFNHPNQEDWHISVDASVLDTTNGLVELLTSMTDLNKQDFNSFIQFCLHDKHKISSFCSISNNHFLVYRSIEMDHVKPSLVHNLLCIQSIDMIPMNQFEVIPNEQYKKCENKIKKTQYTLHHPRGIF